MTASKAVDPWITPAERPVVEAIASLIRVNPFLPERMERERDVLGADFVPSGSVWSIRSHPAATNPNLQRIGEKAEALASVLRGRLLAVASPRHEDLELYESLVLYLLYHQFRDDLERTVINHKVRRLSFYGELVRSAKRHLELPRLRFESLRELPHVFACLFQIQRAFYHTHGEIAGGSLPAARLRAAVWQSIFSHDLERYRRSLYQRMGDITTLVTGPSGTGKELVARAIGLSRYIPFDADSMSFADDFEGSFHALNPSALSPMLIESELFGHRRGAFTGAIHDRAGWLEVCRPLGTVFLDEIGELDVALQVKLLGVLQTRAFQRIGETRPRRFEGKIIAATNRNLAAEMRQGRFREDLYYRLCSDVIVTPSLAAQLQDSPAELGNLLRFIARRVAGEEEAEALAVESEAWIEQRLGRHYPWPGNVRELEQCVRNVLIRKEYHPAREPRDAETPGEGDELAAAIRGGQLTAEELLRRYVTIVYAQTRSYGEAARRLGLDRRTVRSKVLPDLLERLGEGRSRA